MGKTLVGLLMGTVETSECDEGKAVWWGCDFFRERYLSVWE